MAVAVLLLRSPGYLSHEGKHMIILRNWDDLRQFGIDLLTGEACGYGYRVLCDVSDEGVKLFKDVFGLQLTVKNTLPDGWNDSGKRSIMLPKNMFEPLAIFALFTVKNCRQVFVSYDGIVYGVEADDEQVKVDDFVRWHQGLGHCGECGRYGKGGGINRQYRNPGYARNTHAMSGRTS